MIKKFRAPEVEALSQWNDLENYENVFFDFEKNLNVLCQKNGL